MAIKFDELLEALDPSLDEFEEDLDSMWIIIPTERRYDDLTSADYDEFINKYGMFNTRQECWDKIDELAPDRWDAFIPMRLEGVNESCNKELKEDAYDGKGPTVYVNNRSVLKINRDEDWQGSEYFDDLDYYGPFVPKKEFIVDIKDETGSSLSYEALCDYLLSNEDNIYHLKFKNSSLNEAKYWNNKQNTEFYNDIRYKVDGAVYQIMKDIFKDLKIDKLAAQVHNLVPEYDPSWATHKRDDDNNLRLHKVRTGLSASLLDELSDKMNPGSLDRTVNNLRKY